MSWLSDRIWDLMFDSAIQEIEKYNIKNEIEKNINEILIKYENEIFYNIFTQYFHKYNKIDKLINCLCNKKSETFQSNEIDIDVICTEFMKYGNISANYKPQIKSLILGIVEIIDNALNRPKNDEQRRTFNKINEVSAKSNIIVAQQDETNKQLELILKKMSDLEFNIKRNSDEFIPNKSSIKMSSNEDYENNDLVKQLEINSINYIKENKLIIDGSDGQVTAQIMVRKNEFLKKFKSIEELCWYVNRNQIAVELDTVAIRLLVNGQLVNSLSVDSLYTGGCLEFSFNSYGKVYIIDNFIHGKFSNKLLTTKLTITPVSPEMLLSLDLYNDNMVKVLDNVQLSLASRNIGEDGIIKNIYSNRLQRNTDITFQLELRSNDLEVVDNKLEIMNRNWGSNSKIFEWLSILKNFIDGEVTGKVHQTNKTVFSGKCNPDNINRGKFEEEFKFYGNLNYIERRLETKISISKLTYDDIEATDSLYNILRKGKTSFGEFTCEFPLPTEERHSEVLKGQVFWLSFSSTDKYRLFNKEFDIGKQTFIITNAEVIDATNEKIKVRSKVDSINLRVSHKYYGNYSVGEIIKKEKLDKVSPTNISF